MKTLPVAEVRSHFSSLLKEVENGNEIGISFGKEKKTIAVIMSIKEYKKIKTRRLGTLEGRVTVEFKEDWKMTEEEFMNS